jgi:uncharacterized small protein (DUF1192 family)
MTTSELIKKAIGNGLRGPIVAGIVERKEQGAEAKKAIRAAAEDIARKVCDAREAGADVDPDAVLALSILVAELKSRGANLAPSIENLSFFSDRFVELVPEFA